ncbi:MAG TPA: 50S ribosomal protein L13 [Bacteroidia bacterium]|nr:50S ribosomal protein L13 [Bacteroidia bacterium]
MDTLSFKTVSANKATVQKDWLLVDAENETVGRLASKVAYLVRGKHKTSFTPHVDCGDNVVIINADKVRFSGNKMQEKVYTRYTGYPGGQRFTTPKELLAKRPERILELAIGRMLPKTRLGDRLRRNVFIYAGTEHKHEAQNPAKIDLKIIKERK